MAYAMHGLKQVQWKRISWQPVIQARPVQDSRKYESGSVQPPDGSVHRGIKNLEWSRLLSVLHRTYLMDPLQQPVPVQKKWQPLYRPGTLNAIFPLLSQSSACVQDGLCSPSLYKRQQGH